MQKTNEVSVENQVLVFNLIEVKEVTNKKGSKSIMLKLFCPEYTKTVMLGEFAQTGQITYNMFVSKLPAGYKLGEQDGKKQFPIEHFYVGNGHWLPVDYDVEEVDFEVIEGGEVKLLPVKRLKAK